MRQELSVWFGRVAGGLALIAFLPYIRSIFRRKTRPSRASWWIWTFVGVLLGGSYYSMGAHHTLWVPGSYIIGPLIIAILSFPYGEGGWNPLDRACLLGAAASVVVWWRFHSPMTALWINLFIDFLGALPTIKKSYLEPSSEDSLTWILFFLGNTLNLFALEQWTLALASYPVYLFLICSLITGLLLLPRKLNSTLPKD